MPNWNSNRLTVTDLTDEQRTELTSHIENEDLLEHYVPQPTDLKYSVSIVESMEEKIEQAKNYPWWSEKTEEQRQEWLSQFTERKDVQHLIDKYGVADGYNWCINNWGTKWDIADATVESVGSELIAHFNTAWSPPTEGLRRVSEKFPGVTFVLTYQEESMDFCGAVLFKNGQASESEGMLPSELREAWCQANHPELCKKAEAERAIDEYGDACEELDEAWLEVSGEIIENHTLSLATELGAKPIDPEIYARKREKELEQHALFRELMAKLKAGDELSPEDQKTFIQLKV